jgi:hypothetical protein
MREHNYYQVIGPAARRLMEQAGAVFADDRPVDVTTALRACLDRSSQDCHVCGHPLGDRSYRDAETGRTVTEHNDCFRRDCPRERCLHWVGDNA